MTQAPAAASAATSASKSGVLRGTVTDPDLAAVPGATVTLTPAKGAAITATSGEDGSYQINNVPAGVYTLTYTMPGFASVVKQGVRFANGLVVNSDVKLSIEEQSTEVTVTTSSNQVSVDSDSNASAVTLKDKDLDALSDDPDELASELSALAGPSAGPNGGQIYVDGFTGGQLPPKSSIREIRVNQNPFSAQYERAGFGRVEVLTKPGTDTFHGNFSMQGNTSQLNTASPFLGGAGFPAYHTIFMFGGLTGPLSKRASFSLGGSYRDIEDNGIISGQIVSLSPTDTTLCQPGNPLCQVYNYPSAFRAVPKPQTRFDISPRIDYAISDKNTLIVRYQHEEANNKNNGVGNFGLTTIANNNNAAEDSIQISDSHIFSPRIINETRFEYQRNRSGQSPFSTAPTVQVQSAFTGGGSSAGSSSEHDDHFEVQNYTSLQLAKNFIRMGGRLRTNRTALNSNSGSNGTFVYATTADYIANNPQQFSITTITNLNVSSSLTDVGLYFEDDWKIKPNLTLSMGTRFEAQTAISSSHDFAPRVSVAWGVPRKGGNPVTVVRAGYGIFYDRFALSNVLTTIRQNGNNQKQTIDSAPTSACTPTNIAACNASSTAKSTTYAPPGSLRSEYNMQFAIGVDQQLGRNASLSVNYINTNGVHQYMTRNIPNGANNVYQFQSGGVYRQNQLIFNANYRPSRNFSLFGYYALGYANSNTNGATFLPTDSFNPRTDYGRAGFNQKNRLFLAGNFIFRYGINVSPFVTANSGSPYSITTGTDVNNDTVINDRPAYALGKNASNASCTAVGDYVTPPQGTLAGSGYTPIAVNSCTGPANFSFNLRLAKSFGFGQKAGAVPDAAGGGRGGRNGGGGGLGGAMASGGRPGGGGGGGRGGPGGGGPGGGSSNHKYNFTLGAQATNLFNVVPYASPVGTLTSPNFGKSIQLGNSGFNGGSAVRRIQLTLGFNF
jgi:hypothetical protein